MTREPRVFVGASSEAEEHERLVRHVLEEIEIEPIPWRHSFLPGEYGLDSLDRITRHADGAILIVSADDKTWYRGLESFSPRDNVLFESQDHCQVVSLNANCNLTPAYKSDILPYNFDISLNARCSGRANWMRQG
jgi:hypothetical protein